MYTHAAIRSEQNERTNILPDVFLYYITFYPNCLYGHTIMMYDYLNNEGTEVQNPRRIAAYTAMYWHCVYVKFQAKLMSGQSDIMIYNGHVSRSRNVVYRWRC